MLNLKIVLLQLEGLDNSETGLLPVSFNVMPYHPAFSADKGIENADSGNVKGDVYYLFRGLFLVCFRFIFVLLNQQY